MMQGKLAAENIKVHDKRISRSLKRVAPTYSRQREQNTAKLLNPKPYQADYFGHKMHLDQNEKLVMYGCTTVLAIDGYSSCVLAVASMPVKNNIEIYRSVFRYYFCPQSINALNQLMWTTIHHSKNFIILLIIGI